MLLPPPSLLISVCRVVVPPAGYLKAAFELCKQHNVLFVADEIQTVGLK